MIAKKKKSAGKITLKPPNCLTLIQQIRIFSKKPLEGSSGLDNSFSWSKLNNYFLFVTTVLGAIGLQGFFQNCMGNLKGGPSKKEEGGLLLDLYTQREAG